MRFVPLSIYIFLVLWMIRLSPEISVQQFLAGGTVSAAEWLNRNEDGIYRAQFRRVIHFKHPPSLCVIVNIENTKIPCPRLTTVELAPGLKRNLGRIAVIAQIKGVEDQQFVLNKKDPAEGFL